MLNFKSEDYNETMLELMETLGFEISTGVDHDKWSEGSFYYDGDNLGLRCSETTIQVDLQEVIRFTFGGKFSISLFLGLCSQTNLTDPIWLNPSHPLHKLVVDLHQNKNNPRRVHQLMIENRNNLIKPDKSWFCVFNVLCRDYWYKMNFLEPLTPIREPLWEGSHYEIHEIIDSEYCRLSDGLKYRLSDIQALTIPEGTPAYTCDLDYHKVEPIDLRELGPDLTLEELMMFKELEDSGPTLYGGVYTALNFPIILPRGPRKISTIVI